MISKLVDAVEKDIVTLNEIQETATNRKNEIRSLDDLGVVRIFFRGEGGNYECEPLISYN